MSAIPNAATFPDRHTMVLERGFDVPIERLWRAISQTVELDQWFMKSVMDARPGGRFAFEGGWEGQIGEWIPGSCIQFEADKGGRSRFELATDAGPGGTGSGSRLRLSDRLPEDFKLDAPPDDSGALLKMMVAQPGGPGTHWPGVVAGWHGFVDALEAHLLQQPFEDRYSALSEEYSRLLREHWSQSLEMEMESGT
jgi:uncharacterized protein YndB with AHSA1/START domain